MKQLIDQLDCQEENIKDIKNTIEIQADNKFHERTNQHKDRTEVLLDIIETDVGRKNTHNSREIISPIEGWTDKTNSMNKKVINFEEELLNYEADLLNPPDKEQKGISYINSKRLRKLSYEDKKVENSKKEMSALESGFLLKSNKNEEGQLK